MARILYISYDGMAEPLGQGQVLGYLKPLSAGNEIHVISFEKPVDLDDSSRIAAVREDMQKHGIGWTPLRYHKTPSAPATVFDIMHGQARALALAARWRPDIVHARSYLPALIGLPMKRFFGARLLFDIRGFWADERVDGKLWSADGRVYKTVKRLERTLFAAADHVVTLTRASVPIIEKFYEGMAHGPAISVIPTCADLEKFAPSTDEPFPDKGPTDVFTFGYVGSFGTCYLLDETMVLFAAILEQESDARMLIVNRGEHDIIMEAVDRAGVDRSHVQLQMASHAEMPGLIRQMHMASALYVPDFSAAGRAPTKLAEYLGCGVPCVGNTGVGDMEDILEGQETGIVMREFNPAAYRQAARQIVEMARRDGVAKRCRDVAVDLFSLESGVEEYRKIYAELAKPGSSA